MSPQGVWYGIVDFEMALGRYPQVLHPLPMAATVCDWPGSAREKSLEIPRRGWELNPGHGEDRQ